MRLHYGILILLIKFIPKLFRRYFKEYKEAYKKYLGSI